MGIQLQNYRKQKEVCKKHNIECNFQSSKEAVARLTGLQLPAGNPKGGPAETDEELLESLYNIDYMLAQQKKPAKERQEGLAKLAEHMGAGGPQSHRKGKGIRGRIDEIKLQRSDADYEQEETRTERVELGPENDEREVRSEMGMRVRSEAILQKPGRGQMKGRMVVNEKFNAKDLLL